MLFVGFLGVFAQVVEVSSKAFLAVQSSQEENGDAIDPVFFLSVFLGSALLFPNPLGLTLQPTDRIGCAVFCAIALQDVRMVPWRV